ncbi:MAG: hypothetical protein PHV18_04455 [Lachnospiraceae bacterium]|nr:hypothetical protein [Lachnospiraceae bacterium]
MIKNESLTKLEREFAEEHHGLIYRFLQAHRLPIDEFYGDVAIRYTRSVKRYFQEPKLQQYEFSTIAWRAMESAIWAKRKRDRPRKEMIACSLNEITDKGTEYLELIPDPADQFVALEQERELQEILSEVMLALNDRQREHLTARLEGYRPQDIMKQQRKSVQDFHSDQKEIKRVVVSFIEKKACVGGGFELWLSRIFGRTCRAITENTK